jgi:hypothetical protein
MQQQQQQQQLSMWIAHLQKPEAHTTRAAHVSCVCVITFKAQEARRCVLCTCRDTRLLFASAIVIVARSGAMAPT